MSATARQGRVPALNWERIFGELSERFDNVEALEQELAHYTATPAWDRATRQALVTMALNGRLVLRDGDLFVKNSQWRQPSPRAQIDADNRQRDAEHVRQRELAVKRAREDRERDVRMLLEGHRQALHPLLEEYIVALAEVLAGGDKVAEVKARLAQMAPPPQPALSAPPVGFGELARIYG